MFFNMPRAHVRTVIDLPLALAERLHEHSQATDVPKAALIRRALDQYLPSATQPVAITTQEVE